MWIYFIIHPVRKVSTRIMRREEIAILMQGLTLPNPRPCTSSSLLPAMEQPFSPPPSLVEPFEIFEPVDTCGQAHVRWRASGNMSSTPPPVSTIISVMPAPSSYYSSAGYHYTNCYNYYSTAAPELTVSNASRTTDWWHRKGLAKVP